MDGICTAWALCAALSAHQHGKPLPREIIVSTAGDWTVTLNHKREAADGLHPFCVKVVNKRYLATGFFDPTGGGIGGYSESQLIEDLKAAMPEAEWRPLMDPEG